MNAPDPHEDTAVPCPYKSVGAHGTAVPRRIERTVANDSEVGISLTEAAIEFILAAVRSPQNER